MTDSDWPVTESEGCVSVMYNGGKLYVFLCLLLRWPWKTRVDPVVSEDGGTSVIVSDHVAVHETDPCEAEPLGFGMICSELHSWVRWLHRGFLHCWYRMDHTRDPPTVPVTRQGQDTKRFQCNYNL